MPSALYANHAKSPPPHPGPCWLAAGLPPAQSPRGPRLVRARGTWIFIGIIRAALPSRVSPNGAAPWMHSHALSSVPAAVNSNCCRGQNAPDLSPCTVTPTRTPVEGELVFIHFIHGGSQSVLNYICFPAASGCAMKPFYMRKTRPSFHLRRAPLCHCDRMHDSKHSRSKRRPHLPYRSS